MVAKIHIFLKFEYLIGLNAVLSDCVEVLIDYLKFISIKYQVCSIMILDTQYLILFYFISLTGTALYTLIPSTDSIFIGKPLELTTFPLNSLTFIGREP